MRYDFFLKKMRILAAFSTYYFFMHEGLAMIEDCLI
jgi:hypothetical protein